MESDVDFMLETELSAIRPDEGRVWEMNRQMRDQINYLQSRLNSVQAAKYNASAKANVLE
jgi:hypothetical protein